MGNMQNIDIQELREAAPDGGGFMGYFAKGHWPTVEFIEACKQYARANDQWELPEGRMVQQAWWRTIPMRGEPGFFEYRPARPGERGAYKVTVADVSWYMVRRRENLDRRAEAHGHSRGIGDAAEFVHDWIASKDWLYANEFSDAFRKWRSQEEQKDREIK